MCLRRKKKGKSKVLSQGFVYVIQKPVRGHYNSCMYIAQMYTVIPQLLNQINEIRQTKL